MRSYTTKEKAKITAGALVAVITGLILTASGSSSQSDEEILKADLEASRKRAIEASEKTARLCWGLSKEDSPQPKISENLGEPPNDWSSLRIRLSRSMCFGHCPDYTVEITGNGDVIYVGRAYTHISGI
jgi:hypothetical protein